jgi:hypothetical protein
MAKTKAEKVYRVNEGGGTFKWYPTLDELKAAHPDLTGVKVQRVRYHPPKDIDPTQPEPPDEDDEPEATQLPT